MEETKELTARRTVAASAEHVFALLADPRQHIVLDGSKTLQSTESGTITEAGQMFVMHMHRDDLGDYRTVNTVTEFVPGSCIGWAPSLDPSCALFQELSGMTTGGHTYTYHLYAVDRGTEVVQTYDWSGVTDPRFEAFCPMVSQEELATTLANLAHALE